MSNLINTQYKKKKKYAIGTYKLFFFGYGFYYSIWAVIGIGDAGI
jgi:hypothetical protein